MGSSEHWIEVQSSQTSRIESASAPAPSARRQRDSGYLLLAILLMMALMIIAAMAAAPKIVMQIKRDREEEMIHRGTEYARAIKKYYKKFGRYPANLDQLDNTNSIRFIRKRYKDPLTKDGKWKLLSYGDVPTLQGAGIAGGISAAALAAQSQQGGAYGAFSANNASASGLGSNLAGATTQQAVNPNGVFSSGGSGQGSPSGNPTVSVDSDGIPLPAPSGNPTVSVSSDGIAVPNPSQQSGGQPGGISQGAGGTNQFSNTFSLGNNSNSGQAGANGTTGANGTSGAIGSPLNGQSFGGGAIVGVASLSQDPTIRIYNKKKKYNEWVFIYDPTQDRANVLLRGPYQPLVIGGAQVGTPAGQMNQQQTGSQSPFGQNSFGQQGSFGQGSSGFGQGSNNQPQTPQQPQQ